MLKVHSAWIQFTWKKRIKGKLIFEEIDRIIVHKDWLSSIQIPKAQVSNGPFVFSNHCSVLLVSKAFSSKERKFQISRMLGSLLRCPNIVLNVRSEPLLAPLCSKWLANSKDLKLLQKSGLNLIFAILTKKGL